MRIEAIGHDNSQQSVAYPGMAMAAADALATDAFCATTDATAELLTVPEVLRLSSASAADVYARLSCRQ